MCQALSSTEPKERLFLPSGGFQSSGEHTHTHTRIWNYTLGQTNVLKENTRVLGEKNTGRGIHSGVSGDDLEMETCTMRNQLGKV